MKRENAKPQPAATGLVVARNRGRSRLCRAGGFTLVEVQVAIVIFGLAMVAFLGYTRVNGALIRSAEETRSVDGYADVAEERAIVVIANAPGSMAAPECDLRLEEIDSSGAFPVAEITVSRSLP